MKHLLVCLLGFSLLGFGCSKQQQPHLVQTDVPEVQKTLTTTEIFDLKDKCGKYIYLIPGKIKEKSDIIGSAVWKVCYSIKYNTCVAFENTTIDFGVGSNKGAEMDVIFSARDALTDELILGLDTRYRFIKSDGEEKSDEQWKKFQFEQKNIIHATDCIE